MDLSNTITIPLYHRFLCTENGQDREAKHQQDRCQMKTIFHQSLQGLNGEIDKMIINNQSKTEVLPLASKCTGLPNNQIKCTICGLT